MNKNYVSPEMEIVKFQTEDIITTSLIDGGVAGEGNDETTVWR